MYRLPIEHDSAGIRLDRAIDNFHRRRFASAVFAQHGMGFARHDGQGLIAVGDHTGIAFGDARKMKSGGLSG
jgi:hypothetical protein